MKFIGDERAQSVVIGSLLIFTILVLSFSAYQAVSVPNQNLQVESEHYQEVESQFSQVRSSMINAVGTDDVRSTSINLGVRYPSRAIALNPPPAAGRLETTDRGDVEVSEDGSRKNICRADGNTPTTRSLVYTPGYNEYDEPRAISYESRVIGREFGGGSVFDQRLVRGERISLYLLTGTVSENGIDAYSFEVNGSNQNTTELENPTITIPSRYDANTWETEILQDRSDVNFDDADTGTADRVQLEFTDGSYDVSCAVIGLDGEPEFTPPAGGGDGSGGGGGAPNVNPNAPSDVRFNSVTNVDNGGGVVDLEFENLAGTSTDATEARFSFYDPKNGNPPPSVDIYETGSSGDATTLDFKGPYKELSPAITFDGEDTTDVSLDFDGGINKNHDWFVLRLQYKNGEVGQYFISLQDQGDPPPDPSTPTPTSTSSTTPTSTNGGGSANDLRVVDGSTPDDESKALSFELENKGGSEVTITAFKLTTPGNQNSGIQGSLNTLKADGNNVDIKNGRANGEFKIGNEYEMDKNAEIKSGKSVGAVMEEFDNGNVQLTYNKANSASQSDLTVTFTRADSSTEELYFRVTNLNT